MQGYTEQYEQETQLCTLINANKYYQHKLDEASLEIQQLRAEVRELRDNTSTSPRYYASEKSDSIKEEFSARLAKEEEKYKKACRELETLRSDVSTRKKEYNACDDELKRALETIEEKDQEIDTLKDLLSKSDSNAIEAQSKLDSVKEDYESQISELCNKIHESSLKLDELEYQRYEDVRPYISQIDTLRISFNRELETCNNSIEELTRQKEELEAQLKKLSPLRDELQTLYKSINSRDSTILSLQEELESARLSYNRNIESCRRQLSEHQSEYTKTLAYYKNEKSKDTDTINNLEKRLEKFKFKNEVHHYGHFNGVTNNSRAEPTSSNSCVVNQLKTELESTKTQLSTLQTEYTKVAIESQRIPKLENEIDILKYYKQELLTGISELYERIEDVIQDNNVLRNVIHQFPQNHTPTS